MFDILPEICEVILFWCHNILKRLVDNGWGAETLGDGEIYPPQ